jgi:hydroxymethylbilane synthase
MVQSRWVLTQLEKQGFQPLLVEVDSEGDRDKQNPLYSPNFESPGIFTKQLERALLSNKIDVAVHSLKDLPTVQPPELTLGAITKRASAADILVAHPRSYQAQAPLHLAAKSRVGTSSLRREAQILSSDNSLRVESLRGNVPTRIQKVVDGAVDAVVLAKAGLDRLELDLSKLKVHSLPFIAAPGQGALAIQFRASDERLWGSAIGLLNDPTTARETKLERRILRELEGGCTLPLGVRAELQGNLIRVQSFLGIRDDKGHWAGFHHFDISSPDDETLVAETVNYFRNK